MQQDRLQEVLKRLSSIEGHVAGIHKMVEEDKYCIDILRQTYWEHSFEMMSNMWYTKLLKTWKP